MSWWKKFEKVLHWIEHVKLLFEGALAVAGWHVTKAILTHVTDIPADIVSAIAWSVAALILLALFLIFRKVQQQPEGQTEAAAVQPPAIAPGIPSLSNLLGQNPPVAFDARQYFALAYYSPLTAEAEKNVGIIAHQNYPNDPEAFYKRFIGVGIVAYQHDVTWFTIFGSQIAALKDLGGRGRSIPLAEVKKHYDKAVADYPVFYGTYSFAQWVEYMQARALIAQDESSQMVEISFGGKDFLRFVAHVGYDVNIKKN